MKKKEKSIFSHVSVKLKFRDFIYGGIPKDPELINAWIEAKGEMTPPDKKLLNAEESLEEKLSVMQLSEKEAGELIKEEERVWCGFRRDEKHGLYIRDFMIKANLKEAGTRSRLTFDNRGLKPDLQTALFIYPREISLGRKDPDGYVDIAGHVRTMQGERSILKRCDYVKQAEIGFYIKYITKGVVNLEMLEILFELGGEIGLGSVRSMEEGKFDVLELKQIEP